MWVSSFPVQMPVHGYGQAEVATSAPPPLPAALTGRPLLLGASVGAGLGFLLAPSRRVTGLILGALAGGASAFFVQKYGKPATGAAAVSLPAASAAPAPPLPPPPASLVAAPPVAATRPPPITMPASIRVAAQPAIPPQPQGCPSWYDEQTNQWHCFPANLPPRPQGCPAWFDPRSNAWQCFPAVLSSQPAQCPGWHDPFSGKLNCFPR